MFSACGSQDVPDDSSAPDYSKYEYKDLELNNTEGTATPIEIPADKREYTFTGILQNDFENMALDVDYYKLQLKAKDIISITVSNNSSPFSFRFYNPECPRRDEGCNIKEPVDVANKKASLQDTIKEGNFHDDDTYKTTTTFYIKVSNLTSSNELVASKFNQYLINIKLK